MISVNSYSNNTPAIGFQGKGKFAKKIANNVRFSPAEKKHIQIIMNNKNLTAEEKEFILDNTLPLSINPLHYVCNAVSNVARKIKK